MLQPLNTLVWRVAKDRLTFYYRLDSIMLLD